MKEIIGFLLTLIASFIVIILNEFLKINPLITTISIVSIFIMLLIFLFGYSLKQINEKIENNIFQINALKKDLNTSTRLIRVEKDIEWLKKK